MGSSGTTRVHGDILDDTWLGKYSLLVTSRRNTNMLKTITLACLAAVAFAEPEAEAKAAADPYLLDGGYGYAGHHLGYAGYAGYGGYPYRYGHLGYYGKREADAEPEAKAAADPYLLYGGYGYAGHHLGYAGYAGYPYSYGYYGKREADAEPEAKADPYLLYGGYGHGYAGHLGYAGHYGYPYAGYAYYG